MNKPKTLITMLLMMPFIFIGQAEDVQLEKYLKRSEGVKYPNIIKVNSLALAVNNISVSYERAIIPRLSFLVSGGYKYSGGNISLFTVNGTDIEANVGSVTGFSASPEIRYYLKTCEPSLLEGFYAGLYFRYVNYGTDVNFGYFPEGSLAEYYDANLSLSEVGGGLQLGYQLQLWERLSIDFMFFGPRWANYNIIYEFDQNVSEDFLNDLSDYINDVIDRFGFDYEVELKQSDQRRASTTFSFASVRFGIGIGFAF
jgi:hypothetical protein